MGRARGVGRARGAGRARGVGRENSNGGVIITAYRNNSNSTLSNCRSCSHFIVCSTC